MLLLTAAFLLAAAASSRACSDDFKLKAKVNSPISVSLTWEQNTIGSGDYYILYRQDGTGGWYWLADIDDVNQLAYTDDTVQGGQTYSYKITGHNWSPDSSDCRYSEAYVVMPTGAPVGLEVTDAGTDTDINEDGEPYLYSWVDLDWWENSDDLEEGYEVQRREWGSTSWASVGEVPENEDAYTDFDVTEGRIYTYRVKVYGFDTLSPYSNEACTEVP